MGLFILIRADILALDLATDEDILVNGGELRYTKEALDQVEQRLNALPDYPATTSDGAIQRDCRTDSGSLSQPSALRIWHTTEANVAPLTRSLVLDLQSQGWNVEPPDQTGNPRLTLTDQEEVAEGFLYIGMADSFVGIDMSLRGLAACSL